MTLADTYTNPFEMDEEAYARAWRERRSGFVQRVNRLQKLGKDEMYSLRAHRCYVWVMQDRWRQICEYAILALNGINSGSTAAAIKERADAVILELTERLNRINYKEKEIYP